MKNLIIATALTLSLLSLANAQDTVGDKAQQAKTDAVKAKRAAGSDVRQAGRKVKAAGRKARQAVITRCADGRHTVKGASGCKGHGGVSDPR